MHCPYCDHRSTKVVHTDTAETMRKRFRRCNGCGNNFRTVEVFDNDGLVWSGASPLDLKRASATDLYAHPTRTLDPMQAQVLREYRSRGFSISEIAYQFRLSESQVKHVLLGHSWREEATAA